MSAHHSQTSQFMFLVVGYGWDQGMPPDAASKAIDTMMSWVHGLQERGIAASSSPLARMGKIVSGKDGGSITDGPFAEAKEVVGGYIVVNAADLDAATAIAKGCPLLEHGVKLDVRAMVNECNISIRLREEAERNAA